MPIRIRGGDGDVQGKGGRGDEFRTNANAAVSNGRSARVNTGSNFLVPRASEGLRSAASKQKTPQNKQ